jgi:ATP synthase protein I
VSGSAGGTPPHRGSGGRLRGDGDAGTENPGWIIFGYLLAGMAVYGGIGWLIGRWVGHQSIFLALGMVVGLGLAIALTIFRYGRS